MKHPILPSSTTWAGILREELNQMIVLNRELSFLFKCMKLRVHIPFSWCSVENKGSWELKIIGMCACAHTHTKSKYLPKMINQTTSHYSRVKWEKTSEYVTTDYSRIGNKSTWLPSESVPIFHFKDRHVCSKWLEHLKKMEKDVVGINSGIVCIQVWKGYFPCVFGSENIAKPLMYR